MDPKTNPKKQWQLLFNLALERRTRPDKLERLAKELSKRRGALPGSQIASIFLAPGRDDHSNSPLDPLIPVYVERLLRAGLVDVGDVLLALLHGSRHRPLKTGAAAKEKTGNDQKAGKTGETSDAPNGGTEASRDDLHDGHGRTSHNPRMLDEIILDRAAKLFRNDLRPRTVAEARKSIYMAVQWMAALITSGTSDAMLNTMSGGASQNQLESASVCEGVGVLVYALLDNRKVLTVLKEYIPKSVQQKITKALGLFLPVLSQASLQVAEMLAVIQKQRLSPPEPQPAADAGDHETETVNVGLAQADAVMEMPVINSRAGLYVFIDSLLFARPLTDEVMILSYMQARHKGDIQSLTVDLVVSTFDILSNAIHRNDSTRTMLVLRSFLVNKVPLLIVTLSGLMFRPLNPEFCIREALSRVDPNAFPSFSQSFDIMNNSNALSDVRQDFLLACALHSLIPEAIIEQLLGEPPMSGLPNGGRYSRANVAAQCIANSEKLEEYVNELETADGNAGAIVGALVDVIRNWSSTKETMSLRRLCLSLCRKLSALDVILQFTSPSSILFPLCTLLDDWHYEEDQGEYQPVYDEFGAILLLVIAVIYGYGVSHVEIGISKDSFVAQFLERGHIALKDDELSEAQRKHLSDWIKGLFNAESFSDEVLSSCRPQDFYMLVPTIMAQTTFACSSGVLKTDTMNGGLEYLLETFLLPSLVSVFNWISLSASERSHSDIDVIIPMMSKILRPAALGEDAKPMHQTLLSVIGPNLARCLVCLKRQHSNRSDIDSLIEAVRPYLQFRRSAEASTGEVKSWASSTGQSLQTTLRHTIQSLVHWSSTPPNITVAPPSYTHRQVVSAVSLLGAKETLHAIILEIKHQTEANAGSLALDIATALICAPTQRNSPLPILWPSSAPPPVPTPTEGEAPSDKLSPARQPSHPHTALNLREALHLSLENFSTLYASDPLLAESAVRLSRRVEAQLADTQAATPAVEAAVVSIPVVPASAAAAGAMADAMEGIIADGAIDLSVANAVVADVANEVAAATAAAAAATAAGDGAKVTGDVSLDDTIDGLLGLGAGAGAPNNNGAVGVTNGSNAATAATAAAADGDGGVDGALASIGMDMDMDVLDWEVDLGGSGGGGGGLGTADDDVFAGLELDDDALGF